MWRRVRERRTELQAGACTQDDHDLAVEAFFAWQRRSDRLTVLKTSTDEQLLRLKWRLFEMLRAVDVYVLERGAIEEYYPVNIIGADKPSRAQDFCAKVNTRDAILACCRKQDFVRNGTPSKESEFTLIFNNIFNKQDSKPSTHVDGCGDV